MNKYILVLSITAFVFIFPVNFIPSTLASQELSTMEVVEKIHERLQSTPEMDNWQASVLTTLLEMDKNWEPKKKTIIEKLAVVKNKKRTEKVLNATEYDKEKTRDMTAKYQAEAAKFNKRNESSKDGNKGKKSKRRRGLDLNRDEFFPFGEAKRKDYEFNLQEDSLTYNQRVYVLESRSKQKSADYYEGKYYIHPDTFEVMRAELRPAKNPGPLKLLEMHIDFSHLPEGHLVIRTAKVRIHVGLIIKNIRMESEEIYSDYEVFD
jgi:hypothetical protein